MTAKKATAAKKEWDLPEDLIALAESGFACEKLRDRYIKLRWFGYSGAKKAAIDAEKAFSLFWKKTYDLYPSIKGKKLLFQGHEGKVILKDES